MLQWFWIAYFFGYSHWPYWLEQLELYYKRRHCTIIVYQSIKSARNMSRVIRRLVVAPSNSNKKMVPKMTRN